MKIGLSKVQPKYKALLNQIYSYTVLLDLSLTELCNDKKKKKKKKNTMDKMQKFVIIWPKSGSLMKYLVHRFLLTCSVL